MNTIQTLLGMQFVRYSIAGGIGFVVDAGITVLLFHGLGLDHYTSRAIGIAIAVLTTWKINRRFTFARSGKKAAAELFQYSVAQGVGVLVNFSIYSLLVEVWALAAALPVIALAIASGIALAVNFLLARFWVFIGPRRVAGKDVQ